jgi:hypothetical protein
MNAEGLLMSYSNSLQLSRSISFAALFPISYWAPSEPIREKTGKTLSIVTRSLSGVYLQQNMAHSILLSLPRFVLSMGRLRSATRICLSASKQSLREAAQAAVVTKVAAVWDGGPCY